MIDKSKKILLESKTIAIVGCSSDRDKESNKVARFLKPYGI
jgi:predicted CoA-binding protein